MNKEEAAEDFAAIMLWVNPEDLDPQLFHEYISKKSFEAGADWQAALQPVGDCGEVVKTPFYNSKLTNNE